MTNKGSQSPPFGESGGNGPYTYTLPTGAKLNGFYGYTSFYGYIRGLGFMYKVHDTPEFGADDGTRF